jgi:hypothetical protein
MVFTREQLLTAARALGVAPDGGASEAQVLGVLLATVEFAALIDTDHDRLAQEEIAHGYRSTLHHLGQSTGVDEGVLHAALTRAREERSALCDTASEPR